jgi:hypothetical protein
MTMKTLVPRLLMDKHCFIQCPPDRCDCRAGNPVLAAIEDGLRRSRHYLHQEEELVTDRPEPPHVMTRLQWQNHPQTDA